MTLPDTFAGGTFNLPLKVAKIVRLAESSEAERPNCIQRLWKMGYFLDYIDIIWEKDKIPEIVRKNDPNYTKLAGLEGN